MENKNRIWNTKSGAKVFKYAFFLRGISLPQPPDEEDGVQLQMATLTMLNEKFVDKVMFPSSKYTNRYLTCFAFYINIYTDSP
jgi:hypothetical protein